MPMVPVVMAELILTAMVVQALSFSVKHSELDQNPNFIFWTHQTGTNLHRILWPAHTDQCEVMQRCIAFASPDWCRRTSWTSPHSWLCSSEWTPFHHCRPSTDMRAHRRHHPMSRPRVRAPLLPLEGALWPPWIKCSLGTLRTLSPWTYIQGEGDHIGDACCRSSTDHLQWNTQLVVVVVVDGSHDLSLCLFAFSCVRSFIYGFFACWTNVNLFGCLHGRGREGGRCIPRVLDRSSYALADHIPPSWRTPELCMHSVTLWR